MSLSTLNHRIIDIENAPAIPGLTFRGFQGDADYPRMAGVIEGSKDADSIQRVTTAEVIAHDYAHLKNCDPQTDMLLAVVEGAANDGVIAYQRVTWWQEEATRHRIYASGIAFLLPGWRRKGVGAAMLGWAENRLRHIAAANAHDGSRFFENWATDKEHGKHALVKANGYTPFTYGAGMVRPDLDDIPDLPLPDDFEIRPVRPEHYRLLWDADQEAFRDHHGYSPLTEEQYQHWLTDKTIFTPELWKIAWNVEKNEVAGQVRSFINHAENAEYGRKRGYTEFISVRKPYRRKGIARALIAASLRELKAWGMEEAALGVHVENPNGAFALYESMGFRQYELTTFYRKPMA